MEISEAEINSIFEEFKQLEAIPRKGFKFVLTGDGAAGKTALKERLVKKVFTGQYLATVGVEFTATTIIQLMAAQICISVSK